MTRTQRAVTKRSRKPKRPLRQASPRKRRRTTKAPALEQTKGSHVDLQAVDTPSKTLPFPSEPLPTIPRSNNWSFFPAESKEMSTPETEKRNPRKRKLDEEDLLSPIRFYKKACQRSPSPSPGTPPRCGQGEYTFIHDPTSPGDQLDPMIPKAARVQGFRRTKSGILEASAVLDIQSFLDMSGLPEGGLQDIGDDDELEAEKEDHGDFTKAEDPSIRINFDSTKTNQATAEGDFTRAEEPSIRIKFDNQTAGDFTVAEEPSIRIKFD